MPGKAVVSGIVLVMLLSFAVMLVELFIPISAKIEMNMDCRRALLIMETVGTLQDGDTQALKQSLAELGLKNVKIVATSGSKYGRELNLKVDADFEYSRFLNLFQREREVLHMAYDRTSICRKVVN